MTATPAESRTAHLQVTQLSYETTHALELCSI